MRSAQTIVERKQKWVTEVCLQKPQYLEIKIKLVNNIQVKEGISKEIKKALIKGNETPASPDVQQKQSCEGELQHWVQISEKKECRTAII